MATSGNKRKIPKDITGRGPKEGSEAWFRSERRKLAVQDKALKEKMRVWRKDKAQLQPPKKKSPRPPRKKDDWSPSPPRPGQRTRTA